MAEVLSTLGCKLVRWSAHHAQLTVDFSGEALDGSFKKLDKESKTLSTKVVTTQQVRPPHQPRPLRTPHCVAPPHQASNPLIAPLPPRLQCTMTPSPRVCARRA
eukprot:6754921-Prymnesium_polylepis.2